jgi:hypothetical protein
MRSTTTRRLVAGITAAVAAAATTVALLGPSTADAGRGLAKSTHTTMGRGL